MDAMAKAQHKYESPCRIGYIHSGSLFNRQTSNNRALGVLEEVR